MSNDPKCVLVVDDDDHVRDLVGEILRFFGYRVELAADGEQALAQLSATRPDAIILDLMMPVMDGLTFLQYCAGWPVVVLSAHEELHATVASEPHVQGVLPKPFELEVLLETVRRVLRV